MQWRTHPDLQHRLHPQHPDDLQVIVHDGGPRLTHARPEQVWVTITDMSGDIFKGRVLNVPEQLTTIRQGQIIAFRVKTGTPYAVMVTAKYIEEKSRWEITPCSKCGFTELFDAPSDLVRAVFPNLPGDGDLEVFTAFCPLCGGVQGVERVQNKSGMDRRPWWKFW